MCVRVHACACSLARAATAPAHACAAYLHGAIRVDRTQERADDAALLLVAASVVVQHLEHDHLTCSNVRMFVSCMAARAGRGGFRRK